MGAIRAWQLGLASAEEHGDPIEFRLIGDNLAGVYEQRGQWSDLAELLPRLIMSWSELGRNGSEPIQRLWKQQERILEEFRPQYEDEDADSEWTTSSSRT